MQDKNKIKVLIVDDHAVIRTGLRMMLDNHAEIKVVGEAATRRETLAFSVTDAEIDVILLDIDMNGENGLDLLPELHETFRDAKVLMLTGVRDTEIHTRALQLGASGLVQKEKAADVLIKAIKRVNAGEFWFERNVMGSALSQMTRGGRSREVDPETLKIESLTDREREVITLIGLGLKNKEIANRLFISETTVRHHLTSIFDKLDVADRLELIIYAFRHGLAKLPR